VARTHSLTVWQGKLQAGDRTLELRSTAATRYSMRWFHSRFRWWVRLWVVVPRCCPTATTCCTPPTFTLQHTHTCTRRSPSSRRQVRTDPNGAIPTVQRRQDKLLSMSWGQSVATIRMSFEIWREILTFPIPGNTALRILPVHWRAHIHYIIWQELSTHHTTNSTLSGHTTNQKLRGL
jgi:hypothetical protein